MSEMELSIYSSSTPQTTPSVLPKPLPTMGDSENQTTETERPEGGLRGHLAVFGAFLALFCTFGQMNAFGTFQTWYATHQLAGTPPATISWIGSLQLWVFFFSGGLIGRAFDLFGPCVLMISGTVLLILSIMLTSISTQYYQYILSQGVLFGLGVGLLFYPSMASVSTYYSRYKATALGIVAAGSSLGGVIFPIMLQHLFETVGFGWGVRISGLISAVCCMVALLTVTSRSPPKKMTPRPKLQAFADPEFMFLAAGSGLVALGLFVPFFYIVDYAHHVSIPEDKVFYVLAVMNAGGVVGRIAPAYLSDGLGRFNLLTPAAFLSGLSCLVFWMFTRSMVSVMLFAAVYGFFSGAFISLVTPCVAQISELAQIGTRIGMLYTIISFPSLVGGPAAGALLAHGHGSFTGTIAFSGSVVIAGSVLIFCSKLAINSRPLARV